MLTVMESQQPTHAKPRINGNDLRQYERKAVTLVGRLQSQNGRDAVVVTPDGTEVKVLMGIGSTYSPVVEIHGTVDHAGGEWVLREESFVSFPEEFDLSLYGEFLTLAHTKFRDIFLA